MMIIGCDFHTRYQQIAMLDTETGRVARAIAIIRTHKGAPSKLCLGVPLRRSEASARLQRYLPALSTVRSTVTRFLLDPPHRLHNDGSCSRPNLQDAPLTRALPDSGEYGGASPQTCARSIG